MNLRIIHNVVSIPLIFLFLSASRAQNTQPIKLHRQDFMREALTAQPTRATVWYDASLAGSYRPIKSDLIRGLFDASRALGLKLNAIFAVGPTNLPMGVYYVYTFVDEGRAVRVNQLTFAQSRI